MAETKEVKKENETVKLFKNFTKVLFLEGRDKLADSLYAAAEKVDITEEQESFCKNFRNDLERRRAEKEHSREKVSPARA